MPAIFWLFACAVYWLWTWRGRQASGVRGFLHGVFLGLLCFGILPPLMETPFFYGAALCALGGAAAGAWLEEKREKQFLWLSILLFTAFGLLWIWEGKAGGVLPAPFFRAFLGGMALYAACCGILPEEGSPQEKIRPAIGGGIGFLLAAIFFAGMGIF